MAVQSVANNPLGSYPVLVDKNTSNSEMQVIRLDVGTGTAESRVNASNGLPVNIISGGSGNGAILDGVDSAIKATVLDYASSNPLAVRLTDTAGDYVSAGAGTQYTEDVAAAADPIGTALIVVRNDGRTGGITSTDGDNIAVRGTNAGELYVKHVDAIPVTDNGGALTVDGTVAATQSGTWNITDISGTVSLPTGAATAAKQDTGNTSLSSIDGKITACNTGAVVVSSSALPSGASTSAKQDTIIGHIDGLETVLGTIDADTGNISTKIDTIAGAVSGTEMQVDVLTMPTTTVQATNLDIRDLTSVSDSVSAVQSGTWTVTANAGTNLNTSTLALESGGNLAAIATSASVLDDWDESDRAKVNLIVGQAGIAAGVGATGATVPRIVIANDQGKTLLSAGGSASSSGNNTLVAAGTNKLKVYAFSLTTTSTTAMTCIFQSGAGGTELWRVVLQAPTSVSTGANLAVTPPAYLFATASATLLNLNLSSANAVHYSISYYDEA